MVRQAFERWKAQDIGLEFVEVTSRDEAEIRIGFMQGDGSWSYLGRQILDRGANERTMNFGWDLLRTPREADTALREIGHTLGLPHEHQNPMPVSSGTRRRSTPTWAARDVAWARAFYPGGEGQELPELLPFQPRELAILPGQQRDFVIRHGLFERVDGELRYQAGDDDSGEDRNATLQHKLFQGREYVVRIRLYFSQGSGETAVMMW